MALPLICLPASSPRKRGEGAAVAAFASRRRCRKGAGVAASYSRPVYGGEAWSAQRTKSQLLGFSNNERPKGYLSGRTVRCGADGEGEARGATLLSFPPCGGRWIGAQRRDG
ncbi:MAG: hypothetical protein EOS72_31715 [Mesorhizobium sp.]|nr:MAG: hypothetical protein EOS72_31715 [Mesorhizobium sp.]